MIIYFFIGRPTVVNVYGTAYVRNCSMKIELISSHAAGVISLLDDDNGNDPIRSELTKVTDRV